MEIKEALMLVFLDSPKELARFYGITGKNGYLLI
jgi:hypothetical protein